MQLHELTLMTIPRYSHQRWCLQVASKLPTSFCVAILLEKNTRKPFPTIKDAKSAQHNFLKLLVIWQRIRFQNENWEWCCDACLVALFTFRDEQIIIQ